MLSFDDVQNILDNIAEGLPDGIYEGLNGGIILLDDIIIHPESKNGDLYIMGQYHYDPRGLGRYISIHYGSFCMVNRYLPREAQIKKLKDILYHELTHHLEHMAGDRTLEHKDTEDIRRYTSYTRKTY